MAKDAFATYIIKLIRNRKGIIMKIVKNILIYIISIVISFVLYRFVLINLIDQLPFYVGEYQFVYFIAIIFMLSVFVYIVMNALLNNQLDNISKRILWIQYFFVIVFLLFGRNIGCRGIEFNLIDSIHAWCSDSYSVVVSMANGFMFIPMAYFFKEKTYRLSIPIFCCMAIVCELIQYIFSLGFFDVGDILLYIIGFIIGLFLVKSNIVKLLLYQRTANTE